MTNINPELRKAFDANFEQLSAGNITDDPDFSIWGKSYKGKWKDSMTMFLNDLNDLVRAKQDAIDEAEVTEKEKIESLESKIEGLEQEIKEWEEQSKE